MRTRRTIERVWDWLNENQRVIEVLILLLLAQLITMLLPQSPVPASQSPVFTQWLAQFQPVLGGWLRPLTTLGLFTIRSSIFFRIVLAYLGLLAAVRIDAVRESWHSVRTTTQRITLLFSIGSLFIISGWAMHMLWGWMVPEIINWPDTPIIINEHDLALSPKTTKSLMITEKYGTYLLRSGWSVGLEITATDMNGESLYMLRSSKDELHENLRVILNGSPPEAFFLTPKTQLVYRLHQLEDKQGAPIFIQVYRSASGELLAESTFVEGEDLEVENTRISITPQRLPRYRVVYNPGAPIECTGLILLLACAFLQVKNVGDIHSNELELPSQSTITG